MQKFNRIYSLICEISYNINNKLVPTNKIEISLPTTIEFEVNADMNSKSPGMAGITLYNLSEEVQKELWVDVFNFSNKMIDVTLYAGYEPSKRQKTMPMIMKGTILRCESSRAGGATDTITTMQIISGGHLYATGYANATFEANTEYANAIKTLLNQIPDTKLGFTSDNLPPITRSRTFLGKTINLLQSDLAGYNIFEDLGEVHVLGNGYYIPTGEIQVVSEETGLLGTPHQSDSLIIIETVFEPGLRPGQIIYFSCNYALIQEQQCQIFGLKHKGIISPTNCGKLTTVLTLQKNNIAGAWKEASRREEISDKIISPGEWIKPVSGQITSRFGLRDAPTAGASTNHKGIDIGCNYGTPIKCPANGIVTSAFKNGGYGNYIMIDHGKNDKGILITSGYGHLAGFAVKTGQTVFKGDVIGYVGSTGVSTGPHLHFEIRENGYPVAPGKYVKGY